jgi:hypothetical protein
VTPNQTSSTSVYLGYLTKALVDGDTNEIVIGASSTGGGSNSVTLGNTSIITTILQGGIGISGSVKLSSTQTPVGGSTSGTATFSQPFQGTSYKKAVVYCSALLGTASYTFPTAFTNTPVVVMTSGLATTKVTALSTTAMTITGASDTGPIFVEGY